MAGAFAFGVLADYYPVKGAGGTVPEGGRGAPEDPRGPHDGILLEGLAEGEAEAPKGDMVWDIWGIVSTGEVVCGFETLLSTEWKGYA